jgi:hypothetical protein
MTTLKNTPTWNTAARIFIENIEHGDSETVKDGSKAELLRAGALADCWNYVLNNHKDVMTEILKTDKTLSAMYESARGEAQ